jgi:hypothetical protein
MNTDGDYLWDKTGEPDPEVQQLEEILGTLRYEPRPLEIPPGLQIALQVGRERRFFRDSGSRLAIAATIAMLLLGLGLWLGLQRLQRPQSTGVAQTSNSPAPAAVNREPTLAPVPATNENQNAAVVNTPPGADQKRIDGPRRHPVNQPALATNSNRHGKDALKNPQLALNELEGQAAKDQLMLALRLASVKLAFAQKKTQSTNPRDLIHNQHKIG